MNFNKIFLLLSFLTGLFFSFNSFADNGSAGNVSSTQEEQNSAKIKNLEKIKSVIRKRMKGIGKFEVQPSPIKGLYLVIAPPQVLYISEDANYVIEGDISDIRTGANYTDTYRNAARFAAVDAQKDSMIIFSPVKGKTKHTISVFTDMDCYYCQKLHKEISEFNRLGIEVRYLAYPRQGLNSPSYDKSVSVWCSKDKKAALTKAKNGEKITPKTCDNPVAGHFKLGNELGVRGTPAIVLENGQIYPGYIPAARLSQALDRAKGKAKK